MDAKTDGRAAHAPRVEDDVLVRGNGRYAADVPLPQQAYAYFVRSPHAFARIVSVDVSAAQSAPGVLGVLTATDMEGVGSLARHPPLAGRGGKGLIVPHRPALAGRAGDAYRRARGDGGGRERRRGPRRRRTRRRRIRTAHAGDRCARSARGRRAACVAAGARQPCHRLAGAGPGRGSQRATCRRNLRRGEIRRAHCGDEPAHGCRFDGAARRDGKLRCGDGQLHAARLLAGHDRDARFRSRDPASPEGAPAGADRRCRRRLRAQDRPLSGIYRADDRRQKAWPADPLDVGTLRGISQRQPGARHSFGSRTGARRQGTLSGAARPQHRQSRRLYRSPSGPTFRPSTSRAVCRLCTTSNISTSARAAPSPIRSRRRPIAAPVGRKRTTCSSAWSRKPRA